MTANSRGAGVDMSAYERLEPSFAELDSGDENLHQIFQDEFQPETETPRRGVPFLIIGSLVLVAIVGGGLAFAYKQGVREGNRSAPPVITSSNKPLKVKPVQPGGIIIPNQNRLIYDRLDGKPAKITERLMPAPEDVMDLPSKPNQDRIPRAGAGQAATEPTVPALNNPRVQSSSVIDVPPPPINSADMTPLRAREVETFTITPQGVYRNSAPPMAAKETITAAAPPVPAREAIMPPAAVSGSIETPSTAPVVKMPVISEIRPTKTQDDPIAALVDTGPSLGMNSGKTDTAVPSGGSIAAMAKPGGATAPVSAPAARESIMSPGATAKRAANIAPPLPRPNPRRLAAVDAAAPVQREIVKTVVAAPVAAAPVAAPVVKASGRYVVQIASHRKQVDALSEFSRLQRKSPNSVGNYKPLIQRADLGERGIYYRLRIGPLSSKEEAVRLCASLKAAGKRECLIRRR